MSSARPHCFVLALGLVLGTSLTARAEEKSFSATLPEAQQQAAGLTRLTPEQIATLNNLVQRELILAKQGDSRGFAGEFSQRRSAPERAKAGIDKLTPEERQRLDAAVATAIANQPRTTATPVSSLQSTSASVQAVGPHPEIHGSVTFVAGTSGGGRNFYGSEFEVEQYDPVHHLGIAFSYSELHGKGLYDPCGYGYGYGYRNGLGRLGLGY